MHIVTTLLLQLVHTDTRKQGRRSSKFCMVPGGGNLSRLVQENIAVTQETKITAVLILFYRDNYQYNAHRGKTNTP